MTVSIRSARRSSIGVMSTPGKGTDIIIDLPVETPLPAAAADRLAQARPTHT